MMLLIATAAAEEGLTRTTDPVQSIRTAEIGSTPDGEASGTASTAETAAFYADHATTSPAAALLSADAAQIQRPSTPGDLVVTLGNALNDRSVSVEAAPFWLAGAPALTLEDHVRGGLPTLWRNAAISLAVSEGAADEAGAVPLSVATGARLTWSPVPAADSPQGQFLTAMQTGQLPEGSSGEAGSCMSLMRALAGLAGEYSARREALQRQSPILEEQVALQKERLQLQRDLDDLNGSADSDRAGVKALQEQLDGLDRRIIALQEKLSAEADGLWDTVVAEWEAGSADERASCGALIQARQGLSVDIAGGAAMVSADSSVSGVVLSGFTGWVAPAWVFAGQQTSVVLLLRATGQQWDSDRSATLDTGGRLIRAWSRYALSGEGGYRAPLIGETGSFWTAATLDLRIQEGAWLSGSLGISSPLDSPASLISSLNLTVDFSEERTILPSTTPPIPDIQ